MSRVLANIIVFSVLSSSAAANCLVFPQNERLTNYCILSKVDGKRVDAETANVVIQRLQREGYFGGLSSPQFVTQVYPTFTYSNNIEPPHLNWSSAMFRKRRTDNDEQTTEAGRDYHEVEAS